MTSDPSSRSHLDEQILYYRARAGEYDAWFLREGRYDRGDAHREEWNAEIVRAEEALAAAAPGGRVLELACGTGLWTRRLIATADELTAIDASPEVQQIARGRIAEEAPDRAGRVDWRIADLFDWRPDATWDFIFFGFWLTHVPNDRFDAFWNTVADALAPGGTVFFVDSLWTPDSTAVDHDLGGKDAGLVERRLDDGRTFRVVKVFRHPDRLHERLEALGWVGEVRPLGKYFHVGCVRRK